MVLYSGSCPGERGEAAATISRKKARVSVSALRAFLGCPWGRMDLSTTNMSESNREQSHVSWNFGVIAITSREDNEHSAAGLVGAECDLGIRVEHKAVA